MPFVTSHMSTSLDGFVAGPDQSEENPLGIDGIMLHRWHLDDPKHPVDDAFTARLLGPRGAYIMGRNMFGPVRGEWGGSDWRGWWGPEPPYHAPVFVLTHYAHEPIEMEGGTTFFFVDGFDNALARATEVAGDQPIDVAGGASAVQQALRAGCLNELVLDIVPVLLGQGERLFDDVPRFAAEPVEVATSPLATHVVYRFEPGPGRAH
ncbi:MAG TPA: dihydrofolate reductase family protein [Acidimicrobiales bacterium]|nr:dihydrofolate reductase family protein [Acidimicrobiales bacterium]